MVYDDLSSAGGHLARILLIVHRAQINASTNQTDLQGDLP
jgi:hypothetical protein